MGQRFVSEPGRYKFRNRWTLQVIVYKPRKKTHTQDVIKMQVLNYLPHVTLVIIVTGCTDTTKNFVTKPLWTYIQDDSVGKVSILRGYNVGYCEKKEVRINICPVQIG